MMNPNNLNYVESANVARENNPIKTTRKDYEQTEKRRSARCKALVKKSDGTITTCNCMVSPDTGKRILPYGNGNKYGVTWCAKHDAVYKHMMSYSTENNITVGTPNGKRVSSSLEVEMNYCNDRGCATLEGYNVIMTSDSSVDVEGKSPIALSDCYTTKLLGVLEFLNNNGDIDLDARNVGMHCHVGLYDNPIDFRHIFPTIKDYMDFFNPLFGYLSILSRDDIIRFFGRSFTHYARLPKVENGEVVLYGDNYDSDEYLSLYDDLYGDESYCSNQHLLMFNFQHKNTIECRLYKYRNAKQYRLCIIALEDVASNLRDYYNDIKNGFLSREQAATKYGKKVFNTYKKYIEKARTDLV